MGKEGREVVKGQFQPHAIVTNPRLVYDDPLPALLGCRSTRILFLSPRNSPGSNRNLTQTRRLNSEFNRPGLSDLCPDSAKLRVARKLIA